MRTTRTYALLEVSPEAYAEIHTKLETGGYDHAFHHDDNRDMIDMHGIALTSRPRLAPATPDQRAWDAIRDEVGFGITQQPDEDGELRDQCVALLDAHAKRLAELRAVLDDDSDAVGILVGGNAPAWLVRLHRAACAVVGPEPAPPAARACDEEARFQDLPLRSRAQVVYERELSAIPVAETELEIADRALPGWYAVLDAEGDLVCLVPPGGAVDEHHREIIDARASVVVEILNREPA